MKKRDKKTTEYGSFLVAKQGFLKIKRTVGLYSLAAVLIVGTIGLVINQIQKSKTKSASDTQTTNSLPNWWLLENFGSSVCNVPDCAETADPDSDGLTNTQEQYYHTNPKNSHTVKDELDDGQLVAAGFDPSRSGRRTFDEVASDDSILGESLVLDEDVKLLIAQTQDISKVNIPLVEDSTLKIDYSGTGESYQTYSSELTANVNKYFPKSDISSTSNTLKNGSGPALDRIATQSSLLVEDLKKMNVPAKFVSFHKDFIALYQLLPEVLIGVADPTTGLVSTDNDLWYDRAQAFLAVQQKLDFEKQLLSK